VPILKDVFSRFGNLIDVYLIGQKTCGYVKYASKESAELAMKVIFFDTFLHAMGREECNATGFDAN
jgi:RNA recognition motif. (a.k.a. RRM, RBD, or RNP domain)